MKECASIQGDFVHFGVRCKLGISAKKSSSPAVVQIALTLKADGATLTFAA